MSTSPSLRAKIAFGIVAGILAVSFIGCGGGTSGNSGSPVRLQGAGATFPNPLYQKWMIDYNKLHPNEKFDYESSGSGAGIKQISSNTIDFGGSDAPMTDDQLKAAPGELIHIPTVLGADVVTYNIPSLPANTTLKFSGDAVADIFLGNIKKWNDPKLAKDNPGVNFPDADITVVHRSDPSGTSFVFTDYLSKVSPEWKQKVGANTSVNWPVGVGAPKNEGVTAQIKQTPNSIGYVELIYADQNKLPYADIKDADGEFVHPSLESISADAAGGASQIPPDLRVSITNSPGKGAYPMSSFTYLLVYKDQKDEAKGKALVNFLWWATHDGQKEAPEMIYAPLPADVVRKDEEKIKSITYQGKPLYTAS